LYCTEASAGIYEYRRFGGQGTSQDIWQSTIRISTTTKYILILPAVTAGAPQMIRLEKRPKAGACSSGRIRAGLRPRLLRRRRVPPRRIRICTFCAAPPWRGSPAVAPSPSSSGRIRTCLFHRGRIVVPESSSALVPPPSVDPLRPGHLPWRSKLPRLHQAARQAACAPSGLGPSAVAAEARHHLHRGPGMLLTAGVLCRE